MTSGTFLIDRTDSTVDVGIRYPLWASIPTAKRATLDDAKRAFAGYRTNDYVKARFDKYTAVLAEPKCAVATKVAEFRGKFLPCTAPTGYGEDLCKRHGGTGLGTSTKSRGELEAENAELRAKLAAAAGIDA